MEHDTCSHRRVSRAATDDESDARHSNETGVKKKHEKTRKEAYAQSRTRSVWLNRIMTRCLITNYAAYATTDSVVAHRDYVTSNSNVSTSVYTFRRLDINIYALMQGIYSNLAKGFPDLSDILFHSYAFFIHTEEKKHGATRVSSAACAIY